jgi:undecaprenyl-diphosphatase
MEAQLLLWVHAHANPLLDTLFVFSHHLGNVDASVALVLLCALWHAVRGEKREALAWFSLGLSTLALLNGLKAVVGRIRPALWPRLIEQDGYSFPSGHALAAATFYPLLAFIFARRFPHRAAIAYALAAGLVFFVGFGRLYLGVHWPSDVASGWTIGIAQSAIAIGFLRRGAQRAKAEAP